MPRRRRVIVVTALAVVAALAGAEIALRAYGFGRGIRYQPHTVLGWEMVPGQRAFNVRGRAPVRVNGLGFRGPEIPVPRPASTYRILFLGDGSTIGNQTPEAATFPFLVQDELRRRWPERPIDVAVGAVSSYQLEQEVELLRACAPSLQPSAVVIGFCWNDWAESIMRGPGRGPEAYGEYRGSTNAWQRTALADFLSRLGKIRARFQQTRSFARREGLPPPANDDVIWAHVEAMLDALTSAARGQGAEVVLLVIPARMTQHDAAAFAARRARLDDWAARRGVRLADPSPAFAAAANADLYLDEVHLGRSAQPLVAASVVAALAAPSPRPGS